MIDLEIHSSIWHSRRVNAGASFLLDRRQGQPYFVLSTSTVAIGLGAEAGSLTSTPSAVWVNLIGVCAGSLSK